MVANPLNGAGAARLLRVHSHLPGNLGTPPVLRTLAQQPARSEPKLKQLCKQATGWPISWKNVSRPAGTTVPSSRAGCVRLFWKPGITPPFGMRINEPAGAS